MYDPKTVAFDIKFPWGRPMLAKDGRRIGTYAPSFITIWHNDPERPDTGNRRDDSCGWFDRTPGEYADAVAYVLKDQAFVHEVALTLARRVNTNAVFYEGISEKQLSWPRLSPADSLAVVWMVAQELELRRWWNGQNGKAGAHGGAWYAKPFMRRRPVIEIAARLALNPIDNLSSSESPEAMVRLVAAALNRHFKPWWRHPRWHIHHWSFQVHPLQKLRRFLFERCASCGKGYPYGYSPIGTWDGDKTFHHDCYSSHAFSAFPVDESGEPL